MGHALLAFSAVMALALPLAAQPHAMPRGGLDRCLGDRFEPLDPKLVARTWRALASGKPAPPLPPLKSRGAGHCVTSWWRPVEPEHACGHAWRLLDMGGAGTLVVDVARGTWRWRDGRDEVRSAGDALVVRPRRSARDDGGPFRLATTKGDVALPGSPEAVLGDRAVVSLRERAPKPRDVMRVVDTRTMRALFTLAPRAGDESDIVAVVMTPTALGAFRSRTPHGGTEAFVVDAADGALLASVADAWPARVAYPQRTSDGGVVLAAWHATELEVVHVRAASSGAASRVVKRVVDVKDIEAERAHAGVVLVQGAGDTVAVALGRHVVIVDTSGAAASGAPAERIATGPGPQPGFFSLAGLAVHEGGRVVSYPDVFSRHEVVVVDARDGTQIVRGDGVGFVEHPQLGRVLALEDIRASDAEQRVILVKPDGDVVRGARGTARVGRFDVATYAGAPGPLACDARALSVLPPLLRHPGPPESDTTYVLPAELVR